MWSTDKSQINPAWPEPYKAMAQADWDKEKAVLMTAANKYFERTGNKQQLDVMVLKATTPRAASAARWQERLNKMLEGRGMAEDCVDISDLSDFGVSDEMYRELSDQGLMPPAIVWDAFSGDGLCWDRRVFCSWAGDRGFKYGKSTLHKTTSSYVAALKNRFGSKKFAARDVLSISLKNIDSTRRSLIYLAEKGILKRCKNKYWFDDFSEVGK